MSGFNAGYAGFDPWSGQCSRSAGIFGREPAAAGRYPVFVYLVATAGLYDGSEAAKFVDEMAGRGFVAASVEYDTLFGVAPEALDAKSECIFNPGSAASAITRLCARSSADCDKGVAVGGFSQGGFLAARAHNHDRRSRYFNGGGGCSYTPPFDPSGSRPARCRGRSRRTSTGSRRTSRRRRPGEGLRRRTSTASTSQRRWC